ncbi:MAG: DUF4325 domain-containing protein [bacterium]
MSNYDQAILDLAKRQTIKTSDVGNLLHNSISRQQIHTILSKLVNGKKLIKSGSTKYTIYVHPDSLHLLSQNVHLTFSNQNLSDETIFQKIMYKASFLHDMSLNFSKITHYGVTEIVNNAIEHSSGKKISVSVSKSSDRIQFIVSDNGVGVYNNIMQKRGLHSDLEAIQDLLKGKTTTAARGHSGEGIFFTSKAVDQFILESFGTKLRIDNDINDYSIEKLDKPVKGTRVTFTVSWHTQRVLRKIFDEYVSNPGEIGFDKTMIKVKLYAEGVDYVSRSQARRVVEDLDKFKTIILDFDQISSIGQAFADEVFRVFKSNHPSLSIQAINTVEPVQFMIDRVEKS